MAQEVDRLLSVPGQNQIREDLAQHRGKLEAVARETGGEDHMIALGVAIDDKVLVAGGGVHTHSVTSQRAAHPGNS